MSYISTTSVMNLGAMLTEGTDEAAVAMLTEGTDEAAEIILAENTTTSEAEDIVEAAAKSKSACSAVLASVC